MLSPISVLAKQIMQSIWILKLDWDEKPPDNICDLWYRFSSELKLLKCLAIPRNFISNNVSTIEMHGFCDASEKFYACVIYFRVLQSDKITSFFVIGKSKIAPLKTISIPR